MVFQPYFGCHQEFAKKCTNVDNLETLIFQLIDSHKNKIKIEEGSNASIMPPFFKTLITQDLKLKSQNIIIRCDLCYFLYVLIKNYHISILFLCESIS